MHRGAAVLVAAVATAAAGAAAGPGAPLAAGAASRLGSPWKPVGNGVEVAPAAELGGDPGWAAKVVLVDPARATFLVRYDPGRPPLAEWRKRYPAALAIFNGSFYSVDGPRGAEIRPTCDLITAGTPVRGAGCHVKDALFFGARAREATEPRPVTPVSRERRVPRLLGPEEFRQEHWSEALKSFPALVRRGAASCPTTRYCAESSRTTALAQMKDGRIAIFASQWPAVRKDVGRWLAGQMGAVDALNLDGGPETTLALRGESAEEAIAGHAVGLPLVIVVVDEAR